MVRPCFTLPSHVSIINRDILEEYNLSSISLESSCEQILTLLLSTYMLPAHLDNGVRLHLSISPAIEDNPMLKSRSGRNIWGNVTARLKRIIKIENVMSI